MPGSNKVGRFGVVGDGILNGLCPVGCADSGGDAVGCVDADGKSGLKSGCVLNGLGVKAEAVTSIRRERQADEPSPESGHKIDYLGRNLFCGTDQVALVLAILGIDKDYHFPLPKVLDDFRYFAELYWHVGIPYSQRKRQRPQAADSRILRF
jgi:hypothetical protein